MIKITKQNPQAEPAGPSRKLYEALSQDKKSNLPMVAITALASALLYLKTTLVGPGAAESPAGQGDGPADSTQEPERPKPMAQPDETPDEDPGNRPRDDDEVQGPPLPHHLFNGSSSSYNELLKGLPDVEHPDLVSYNGTVPDHKSVSPDDPFGANDNARFESAGSGSSSRNPSAPSGGGSSDNGGGRDPRNPDDPSESRNRAPRVSGPVALQDVQQSQFLFIAISALLANATDPDRDVLVAGALRASSGSLERVEGGWIYAPAEGHLGPVTFSYLVSDARLSVEATAMLDVVRTEPIVGTVADDNLLGTHGADTIEAGEGDDNVDARGGSDVVIGGAGNDHIVAAAGNDTVHGGSGDDVIFGQDGHDVLVGGDGNDRIHGGAGDDMIYGDAGNDLVLAGIGNDVVYGGDGCDSLLGEEGRDVLLGGAGADTLDGGAGNDVLAGEGGSDNVLGGVGNDVIIGSADGASDTLNGGEGHDAVSYAEVSTDLVADLRIGTITGASVGTDMLESIEHVALGSGNDTIIAALDAAADTLDGAGGTDLVDYGQATRSVMVDLKQREATGADIGSDKLLGIEQVRTGSGNDVVQAGGAVEDNALFGGNGVDTISYEASTSGVFIDLGTGEVVGDDVGRDFLDDFERIFGSSHNDMVIVAADTSTQELAGGLGVDVLSFARTTQGVTLDLEMKVATGMEFGEIAIDGFEKIIGGKGDDEFIIGNDAVAMTGGQGDDRFVFNTFEESSSGSEWDLVHEITDLQTGDRIIVRGFELQTRGSRNGDSEERSGSNATQDRFADVYGSDGDGFRMFRFRIEKDDSDADDALSTLIDILDQQSGDGHALFTILCRGSHDFAMLPNNGH